jgi:hypothetical protein
VPFLPDIATSEMLWFGITCAALVVGSVFFYNHAPLEHHADHLVTPLHTVAPWYFLWIQGMLKLGDKSIWGVIVPGGLLTIHLLLGYLDYNPSRRAKDRRFAWSLSFFSVGAIVILSFMGTSAYLVRAAPETEVNFEFMRPERLGEHDIRTVPFEEMIPGTYDTAALPESLRNEAPELYDKLQGLQDLIVFYQNPALEQRLDQGRAIVTIADWQIDGESLTTLKKITMALEWIDEDGVTPATLNDFVFAHRDAIYTVE